MNLTRIMSTVGAGAVAGVAAYSSWQHMVATALRVGERSDVALVLPLSVDGLLVTASMAMVADRRCGRTPRWSARVAFAVGVAASLGANVAHAHPNIGARIVAGWPAIALLLVVELLSRSGRTEIRQARAESRTRVRNPATQSADDLRVSDPARWIGPGVRPVEPTAVPDTVAVEDALTVAARAVAGDLTAAGRRVTRDGLAAALRARGHRVGTDRAAALARAVAAG